MAKIIAIANQKGGIGKTTTATTLAAGIRLLRGKRVLLVDTDPQCSASDTYQAQTQKTETLYNLLIENEPVQQAIQHTQSGDIIACNQKLSSADKMLTGLGDERLLTKALAPILPEYDYIIIDTPPGAGILLHNALTAAQFLIIPITADRYGLQGLSQLRDTVQRVQENTNKALKIAGMLLIKHNERTNISKAVSETFPAISKELQASVFDTYIRESVATKESQTNRMTLYEYAPNSTTAQDYAEFIDELEERGII